jgi:UDP-N-acetylmuramoylalanine--D-glutamate ligase
MKIKELKFGILGLARSGVSSALKILEHSGEFFISEIKTEETCKQEILSSYNEECWLKLRPHCEFGGHTAKILDCDVMIVSPGIPTSLPIINQARQRNVKVISEIEFGYQIKDKSSKIIAVTGSNGKSTTVSLIHHILKNAGYKSLLAGNIGNSLTSFPIEKRGFDYLVLELSSFQLELIEEFQAETAVLLNISEDHLDRHSTLDRYVEAKMNIFRNQKESHKAILNSGDRIIRSKEDRIISRKAYFAHNQQLIPEKSKEAAYLIDSIIKWNRTLNGTTAESKIDVGETKLPGIHNRMNMLAALLAVSDEVSDIDVITESLRTFTPLPHRLENVGEINGIEFINDSKATNTEAVRYALTAFSKPLHVIMGGYEKGEDYSVLLPYLKEKIKRIYLIGNSKNNMRLAFQSINGRVTMHQTLLQAVHSAFNNAAEGDAIILSPACASYDMYRNFEHRGEVFRTIVEELKRNEE